MSTWMETTSTPGSSATVTLMLTGAFPSRSGRTLFNWKNRPGDGGSAHGTAAEIAVSLDHPRRAASAAIRVDHFPTVTPCFIDRTLPGEAQRRHAFGRDANSLSRRPADGSRLLHVLPPPFAGAGLGRRKARARALRSPSASVTRPCFCRPCPSPARTALSYRVRVWAFSAILG